MPTEPPTPPSRGEADLFNKAGADKTVVLRTRQWMVYPFTAANWLDLRVGLFLSVTKKGPADPIPIDDVTGLTDSVGTSGFMPARDHYFIGLKTRTDTMPGSSEVIFAGFSNFRYGALGPSVLSASDNGTGAGTDYWWPHNGGDVNASAVIVQENDRAVYGPAGLQQHFPGPGAVAAGYALMLGLRFLRPAPGSGLWTMEVKTDGVNADMFYSNTPTKELLISKLQAWPLGAVQIGPMSLDSFLPDALFCYWPFTLSRLRIHSVAVYEASP